MRRSILCLIGLLLVALLLPACSTPQAGPMIWLDRPLDGSNLPLAPVTILAHASDEDLVASFEFYVDGTLLARVPSGPPARHPGPYATGGGTRSLSSYLGDATVGWNPTVAGVYTITVRAVDSRGNVGAEAISVVTVGQVLTPSPWPTVAPEAPPIEPPGEVQITFTADRTSLSPGECAILLWSVVGGELVHLDGGPVPYSGETEVCPQQTTTYTLAVYFGEGPPSPPVAERELVIAVSGPPTTPSPTYAAPTVTPTRGPTASPVPPTFTPTTAPAAAPRIVSFQANPSSILTGQCSTLSWAVEGALTGVWLDGEGVGDHDSDDKCPRRTTTYTLVARSPGGEDTANVTVTVTQPPFSADLAITDLYPQTLYGPIWVRITNRGGPGTVNDTVQLTCQWNERDPIEGTSNPGQQSMPIPISNLGPNQTQEFNTDISVNLHSYTYDMTCSMQVPFNDPNPGNNTYSESFP